MRTLFAALAAVALAGASALADGMIFVRPMPEFTPIPLSVKYHKAKVAIDGPVATTYIDQVFVNPNDRQLEGEYVFPLPEDAAISRFSMFIDGKEAVGETLEAGKARSIYEEIVRSMKDPALLEYTGRRAFRCRIFPIPARGEKRVTLQYSQVIKTEGGLSSYVYPLDTERFSSQPIEQVSIEVEMKGQTPIKSVFSPSHAKGTDVVRKSETSARTSYEEKGTKPDKDYVLYWTVSEKDIDCSVVCHKPSEGKGVFLALVSPKLEAEAVLAKDIIFVLDTSGSMRGAKMDQAIKALRFCLQGLKDQDRFGVIPFSTESRPFAKELAAATKDAVADAVKRVEALEARGGTNINDALADAVGMCPKASDRPAMVVFITDGEPTVGETDIAKILKNAEAANAPKARVFVFGVGTDLNTHLLDKLAEMNRGAREYVLPEEDIEIKVSNFFTKVSSPVLSDVEIDWGGLEVSDLVPAKLPDIFRGSQMEIFGRYTGGGARAITVTGTAGGKKQKFVFDASFPKEISENDLLPRLWAVRQVGNLLDKIRLYGESKELKDEVVAIAREYGIMTPYTSMLVLEDEARLAPNRRAFGAPVAEEAKQAAAPAGAMRESGGAGAVAASRAMKGLADGAVDADELSSGLGRRGSEYMKTVGAKTFYLKDGLWRDASYDGKAETTKVKFMSTEYFDLIAKNPKLGRFLAVGEQVLVVFEGKVYEVTKE